jgi:hypothetical protein
MPGPTKAGHMFVTSNVGALGEGVFKVGMPRRSEPPDRVTELGDASVPFPFGVHMMIQCDDAPALENATHKALHKRLLNRANPRKEIFRSRSTSWWHWFAITTARSSTWPPPRCWSTAKARR